MGIRHCFSILVLSIPAFAQPADVRSAWQGRYSGSQTADEHRGLLRGQVSSDMQLAGSMTVEFAVPGHSKCATADVDPGGTFEIPALPAGSYTITVVGRAGIVLFEDSILLTGGYQNITIHISDGSVKQPKSADATVSIRQLQHKVAPAARKEFEKGEAESRKRNFSTALTHYQNATRLDPDFAAAYNGGGNSAMALGQVDLAAEELRKAVDLVPDYTVALANLSIALCRLEQFHDAAPFARRALRLAPNLLTVHYVLGLSLMREGGDATEALANLERAAPEVPKARLLAATILAAANRTKDAAEQVRQYLLSSPKDEIDRQKIQAWLEQLR